MNTIELKNKLMLLNVREDAYCLDGGLPNEAYCIGRKGFVWEVYYSEKGQKNLAKRFFSENKATQYFLDWIVSELKE